MIFKIPELLAYASSIFTLEPGDLLFTGTPSGASALHPGDVLETEIERIGMTRCQVA
jgi:2-keto-4-pentenoate hydratase/2-oxohepta-3-ene-1,7-dioic acid hydratase in catechol pathway